MKSSILCISRRASRWCFTLSLVAACCATTSTSAAETVPTWRTGLSAWNGSGYTLPPITSTAPTAAPPTSTTATPTPYTVPVDPAAVAASVEQEAGVDVAWLESFVAADAIQRKPMTGLLAASSDDGAVSQVAAQGPLLEAPINIGVIEESQLNSITERLAAGEEPESQLPLEEEVTHWYQYPWLWLTSGWTNHAELGLDGANGNADTLSITTGLHLRRKTDTYTLGIDLEYRQASNKGVTTLDNGRYNMDYDRVIADSRWTNFAKFAIEWDRFKNFDLRLSTSVGAGYYWVKDDKGFFITRFGAGGSQKIGAPIDSFIPEAIFGVETERQVTSRQKIRGKIEYFPSWKDFTQYRLVSDASWEILLDGTDNFSLKLSATDRYDSNPQGALPNDIYYSALILYKF